MSISNKTRIARVLQKKCVACGSCVSVCPTGAIYIDRGMYAIVKEELCVGCGKCSRICPASLITTEEREP